MEVTARWRGICEKARHYYSSDKILKFYNDTAYYNQVANKEAMNNTVEMHWFGL